MKTWLVALGSSLATAVVILSLVYIPAYLNDRVTSPLGKFNQLEEYPLEKYSFERLTSYQPVSSPINLEGVITQEDKYSSYLFTYQTQDKKVSGQLNKPKIDSKAPVVIMLRGFVDPAMYQTGVGTRNAAAVFAANGYVTVAPDFLGYGESDMPDNDSFAARVQRPITVLDLLASVKQLDFVDPEKIFIWGHSNGGQIAISVLEITQADYPTSLWAPVTKPFPYSILYYTDEYDDYGKDLRHALAIFESTYDANKYSIHPYLDKIKAPVQLHQGGADEEVPLSWSDDFVEKLESLKVNITYYRYPNADHNLRPDWNTVVQRDLSFFNSFLDN